MKEVFHIIITKGRSIVSAAPVDRVEATTLLNILLQRDADLGASVDALERTLESIRHRKLSNRARIQAGLRDIGTGLYISAEQGISISSARMLVKAYRLNNRPGLETLIGDLRRVVSGTVKPGANLMPFLSTEGILPKNG